jgi:hypothetical protein
MEVLENKVFEWTEKAPVLLGKKLLVQSSNSFEDRYIFIIPGEQLYIPKVVKDPVGASGWQCFVRRQLEIGFFYIAMQEIIHYTDYEIIVESENPKPGTIEECDLCGYKHKSDISWCNPNKHSFYYRCEPNCKEKNNELP